jgi:hypothetical protein
MMPTNTTVKREKAGIIDEDKPMETIGQMII